MWTPLKKKHNPRHGQLLSHGPREASQLRSREPLRALRQRPALRRAGPRRARRGAVRSRAELRAALPRPARGRDPSMVLQPGAAASAALSLKSLSFLPPPSNTLQQLLPLVSPTYWNSAFRKFNSGAGGTKQTNKKTPPSLLPKPCPGSEACLSLTVSRLPGARGGRGSASPAHNFTAEIPAPAAAQLALTPTLPKPPRRTCSGEEGTQHPPHLQSYGEARQESRRGWELSRLSLLIAGFWYQGNPWRAEGREEEAPIVCTVTPVRPLRWAPGADAPWPSPDSRVPSNRVAMVSRKVFWGASNPFITGIFPAPCEVPHQSLPTRVVREESAEGARGKGGRRRREGRKGGEEDGDTAAPPPAPGAPRSSALAPRSAPTPGAAAGRGGRGAPRTGAEPPPRDVAPRGQQRLRPLPSPPAKERGSEAPAESGREGGRVAGRARRGGRATFIYLRLERGGSSTGTSSRPGVAGPSSAPHPGLIPPSLAHKKFPRLEAY